MKSFIIIFSLFSTLNLTCSDKKIPNEGFVKVKGGKVWYKIFGSEKKTTPVLLLHGEPGFPSDYFKPLQELASDRQLT